MSKWVLNTSLGSYVVRRRVGGGVAPQRIQPTVGGGRGGTRMHRSGGAPASQSGAQPGCRTAATVAMWNGDVVEG